MKTLFLAWMERGTGAEYAIRGVTTEIGEILADPSAVEVGYRGQGAPTAALSKTPIRRFYTPTLGLKIRNPVLPLALSAVVILRRRQERMPRES